MPKNLLGARRVIDVNDQFDATEPEVRAHTAAIVASNEAWNSGGIECHLRHVRIEVIQVGSKNDEFGIDDDASYAYRSDRR